MSSANKIIIEVGNFISYLEKLNLSAETTKKPSKSASLTDGEKKTPALVHKGSFEITIMGLCY
jgi:hypothetical protein